MSYLNDLRNETNKTITENGAITNESTFNPLVDFFALAGATRNNPELGVDLFVKAFAFDRLGAIRVLFYLRDVRGGQGERQLFRNCLHVLSEQNDSVAKAIAKYVPEYGRWDDLFSLQIDTCVPILMKQIRHDLMADEPSLLAKWMPSENTSSKVTRNMARNMMKSLGYTPRSYRKVLSKLRKKIELVEQKMSSKKWSTIEYSKVPSQAGLKYSKAFQRNDEYRYGKFLEAVSSGDSKINTGTLYPHQIYNSIESPNADELWNNLPDYTQGKNAIVVADVSGSMNGEPMSVSVSLALYFAERNKGQFKDHFITFSEKPKIQKVIGTTLRDKMNSIQWSKWGYNTNLQAVFDLLLDTAIKNDTPVSEMPETIYIISDMEFDQACEGKTNYELIESKYSNAGYKRPNLVFWNVDARNSQVPVMNERGTTLVSGLSPSTFKLAVENKTPEELVEEVILSDRYNTITIS